MYLEKDKKNNYILAVDDAPDNLLLVEYALQEEGYEVVSVNDGFTALKLIEKSPPALILLDVMMPGMDGYEVTKRVRQNKNLPFIPILLITAYEESSVVKGLDEGADDFIRKPVKIDELQARVRSLLRLKQTIDQRENFVSCLTHDLRTPLVAAERMLQLIDEQAFGQVTKEMHRAIMSISSSNQNMLKMLNTLLEVHCYEVGEKMLSFTPFNLREMMEEVITELTPLAEEKGLDLRLKLAPEVEEIVGDRLELRRVITNLMGNAIKFTDHGFIEVRTQTNKPGLLTIEVEDTGAGIDPQIQATIFERFRKGNDRRSGHGLGLHLCKQIVTAHQGMIKLQSELGKGTCFVIHLPQKV